MKTNVTCKCGQRLAVRPELIGKTVRCPKCKQTLAIPQSPTAVHEENFGFDDLPPTSNPYIPAAVPSVRSQTISPQIGTNRGYLRSVASAHRQVNLAVLFYLCMVPVNTTLLIAGEKNMWANVAFGIVMLTVFGFGAISAYRLAAIFRGNVVAVIYAVGLLTPLVGLLLLVSISQEATNLLKQNGIKVGLLGANPAKV